MAVTDVRGRLTASRRAVEWMRREGAILVRRNDNWGAAAHRHIHCRQQAVPEAEWWAMAPPDDRSCRPCNGTCPWARWRDGRDGVDLDEDLARGIRQFAVMRRSALVVGHTSSSILGGKGWDTAAVAALQEAIGTGALGGDAIVTTNGLDTLSALRASGVRRPFLVLPPWFGDDTVAAGVRYYTEHGFSPSAHLRYDPGERWRGVPPGELYPRGMGFAQEIAPLRAQIEAACPPDADGVLIAGTGFRCVAILDALEQELQRPVISANQASLWHCLRLSGVPAKIEGYGNLLRL